MSAGIEAFDVDDWAMDPYRGVPSLMQALLMQAFVADHPIDTYLRLTEGHCSILPAASSVTLTHGHTVDIIE